MYNEQLLGYFVKLGLVGHGPIRPSSEWVASGWRWTVEMFTVRTDDPVVEAV